MTLAFKCKWKNESGIGIDKYLHSKLLNMCVRWLLFVGYKKRHFDITIILYLS